MPEKILKSIISSVNNNIVVTNKRVMEKIPTKNNIKAIMQIQMDQNDAGTVAQDLKEYASILSGSLGYNTKEILEEMSRHDLDHLINTFKKYFNEYVELLDSDNIVIQENNK